MKISVLKISAFLCFSFLIFSCGSDDPSCTTDPNVTVEMNIVDTWIIDGESSETVTFNANGTGTSSDNAFEFTVTNNGNDYHNFNWMMEGDDVVVVTYDYSPDTPVIPFIISENYTALENTCDRIEMTDGFENSVTLTK